MQVELLGREDVQVEVEIQKGVEQGANEGDEQVEEGGSSLNKK